MDLINACLQRVTTFGAKEIMPALEKLETATLRTIATKTGQLERWANISSLRIRVDPPKIVSSDNLPYTC